MNACPALSSAAYSLSTVSFAPEGVSPPSARRGMPSNQRCDLPIGAKYPPMPAPAHTVRSDYYDDQIVLVAAHMRPMPCSTERRVHIIPCGTLLCVSDSEIKLPRTANAFYQRAVGEHLRIGIAALDLLRGDLGALHSRKLRSFDEPPFR